MMSALNQNNFVICASCGARIRADRDRCLRCDEPLRPAPASEPPLSASLTKGRAPLLGTAAFVVVLVAIVANWNSSAPVDDVAQPAVSASAPAARLSAPLPPIRAEDATAGVGSFFDAKQEAAAAYTRGDFDRARSGYEQLLSERPNNPEVLNSLGQVLARQGRVEEAIAKLSRAAELTPGKWDYRFNLAHALGQAQQWDRAITEYRVAAGLFPEDYATQYNLAMVLHKKGDEEAAIPEFEKAIALAPSEPTFHISLATSLEKVGRVADAQREYKQYLEMTPPGPNADKVKAHVEALAGGQSSALPKAPSAS